MQLKTNVMSYASNGRTMTFPESPRAASRGSAPQHSSCACPTNAGACQCESAHSQAEESSNGRAAPDFSKMTAAEKIAYHKARWDRILG
jgi:hypothetical protein